MNVIYSSMDNYAPYLGISMISLLENNKDTDVYVYVLSIGISPKNKQQLHEICQSYGQELSIIEADELSDKFGMVVDTGGFGFASVNRLFVASYLPESVEKAIYIDCDTIIRKSLVPLWEKDLEDNYFMAVVDFAMPQLWTQRLGLKAEDLYYNAGVMVINLHAWREEALEAKFIAYYKENNGKIQYADQDVLNYCCHGRISSMSVTYNYPPNMKFYPAKFIIENQKGYSQCSVEELDAIKRDPTVIHYMGDERPWVKWNHNAYRKYYETYKKMSPWKDKEQQPGKFWYMQVYWLLNHITLLFPGLRKAFFENIGVNKYRLFGKK